MKSLKSSSLRDRLRLVHLDNFKDLSELFLDDPARFGERLQHAFDAATLYADEETEARQRAAREAWEIAEGLLTAPDLMHQVAAAMRDGGYAGDPRPALTAYVAMTSRLGRKPINLALVAPSAAGKNRAVRAASSLMPPEAVYEVSASSPLALVYTPRDFRHSVVIVAEADAIPDEGPAATAVRTLAEENELVYETTVKDPATGKFTTQRIEKPGPICLITTSTVSVKRQLGTRMLEVAVPDDQAQTAAILLMQAKEAAGETRAVPDLMSFVAAQRWLASQGEMDAVIPFAPALAALMQKREVRMRRDFSQLLSAIKAVAFLYCCQRERDEHGYVVARIEDYAYVRWLLGPVFDQIEADGVTPGVRAVVGAVAALSSDEVFDGGVNFPQVVKHLGSVAKTTVRDWVLRAIKGEWLIDDRSHPHARMRLKLGDPLPAQRSALPTPAEVLAEFERSDENAPSTTPLPVATGQDRE